MDNRTKCVLQRKIGDVISNSKKNVAQLHPKKSFMYRMTRKNTGHGNVKSKQHAAARAKKEGKRGANQAAERERSQQKIAAEEEKKLFLIRNLIKNYLCIKTSFF